MTRAEIIAEIKSMPTKHRDKCLGFSELTFDYFYQILRGEMYPKLTELTRLEAAIDATYAYFEAIETQKKYRKCGK